MSHPSQVCMSELHSFMTTAVIINAFQKLGHHPISASLTKKRKGDDREVCIIQFANEDAAKQAVFKLNGKAIPGPTSGFVSKAPAKFKLSQCIGNRATEYDVWVGDLTVDVDDYHFFKFFSERFKTLCNARVILDSRGVSRGYGFLRFSSEEEQRYCLKSMNGSLGLGCRPIKVCPVMKGHAPGEIYDDEYGSSARIMNNDPWFRYTSWNQFVEPKELSFVAVKVKLSSKDDKDPRNDLQLVDYNVNGLTDDLNIETIERDSYLWDALECSKWLPEMALATPVTSKS